LWPGSIETVNLFQDSFSIWFAVLIDWIIPGHSLQWAIPRVGRITQTFFDACAQFVEELQLRARIPGRCDSLMTPLHHALGLGKCPGFFCVVGGRHETDLGTDLFGLEFTGLDFRAFFPPRGRFDELEVTDHYPFEIGHPHALHTSVGRTPRRIL